MNPLFDEAVAYVNDTVHRFYSGAGIEQVVERFADDFSWVGAGDVEFSTDRAEIVAYFVERAPLAPSCEVFDEEFHLVNITERTCTVMGRYRVRTSEESGLVLEERQRCSYELVDEDGVLKIRHVHVSNPYQAMKDERYFPFEAGTQTYEYLQQLLREKTATIELLTEDLADQARRDPLTKLYNQGALAEFVEPLIRSCATRGTGALLVVDIDDFKSVNDTFGHLAGNDLLVGIARALEGALVDEDAVIARIGGDEFIAFLPQVDRVQAREAALRVRSAAGEAGRAEMPVTTSVGAAVAGVDGDAYRTLFAAADRALYEAKRAGKDRVSFASAGSPS